MPERLVHPGKVVGEVCVSQEIHSLNDVVDLVGHHLGYSGYVTVSQEMIDAFAEVTGDHQWIHVDPPRAAAGPFGATIAHGNLTLSLIPGLLDDALSLQMPTGPRINYGYNRVRFVSPVKVNSELRAGARLVSAEPVAQGWQLVVEVTVEARNAPKPACVAELVYRWYPS